MTRLRISKNYMIFSPSLFESNYLGGGGGGEIFYSFAHDFGLIYRFLELST